MISKNHPRRKTFGAIMAHAKLALTRRLQFNFKNAGHDITPEQWQILLQLWAQDGLCQQELANFTHKDRPGITRILDVMEKKGLLSRQPVPGDRRKKKIFLSESGKNLENPLFTLADFTLKEALQGIDPEQIRICKNVLTQIEKNLE